jgi:hypothetical protein
MAALVSATLNLDLVRPLVPRMVNVVPRLVAHSAAPAAKACIDVAPAKLSKTKDNPIGTAIPVMAIPIDRTMFALRDRKDVDRPPIEYLSLSGDHIDQNMRFDNIPSYTKSKRPR